jgi:tetratricopeptide (TPR) repeat protein
LERLEKTLDQQVRSGTKPRIVEQINVCLRVGDYSRAQELLRSAATEFSNDEELSELERLAQDGVKRKTEADRLITESQELFAQQKSADAIQLLRKAYELDKRNALARTILANALAEHAHSIVESDWLEAEKLANQSLSLNPAHPTAKTILSRIVEQKENSSADDWVSQARKLHSSGDLFGAMAWVAEGLAVHSHDPKLLQIQDAIQRDQDARRRQARRGDLDDLRRMQREIEGAADIAAKQALAARIQAVAAKHWTDGEILSIANALLLRLGLVSQETSKTSPRNKGAAVILHVPRPTAPEPSRPVTDRVPPSQIVPSPAPPTQVSPDKILPQKVLPSKVAAQPIPPPANVSTAIIAPTKVPPSAVKSEVPPAPHEPKLAAPQVIAARAGEISAPATKEAAPSQPKQPPKSNSTTLIFVSVAAILLMAATFFFTRRHYASQEVKTPEAAPAAATTATPAVSAPAVSEPAQTVPETPSPVPSSSSETNAEKFMPEDQPPVGPGRDIGALVVVAGQDNVKVFLNEKPQRQLTRAGQLRLPNLELKDYVVKVSKSGFQDPPPQTVRIRKGEEARLTFNLEAQPHLASLMIQGGAPGITVLLDQTSVGTIQADGTLSVSTINPGDHTLELRKERFKPRQLKKHFVAGGAISLAAADVALEAAPGELKITFMPADARVALVKGDLLKTVSSGVPLNLAAGNYTLTARTADGFTSSAALEIIAGQSRTLDLSLAPNGMSKWENPGAWLHEKDSFVRKGGDFVLYGVAPTSGTFVFSAMPVKGRTLQWVFNYTDPKNYILFQVDENNFYRSVIRNGEKTDEIIVPHKGDKKSFRALHIRVSPTEIVHQMKQGETWKVLDRWSEPGINPSLGKFGFYVPGNDQIAVTGFAQYADLNIR